MKKRKKAHLSFFENPVFCKMKKEKQIFSETKEETNG